MRQFLDRLIWATLAAGVAYGFFTLCLLADWDNAVVHPHFFVNNMPALVGDHLSLRAKDFLNVFYPFAAWLEYRPRFLAYLILLLDYHLRFLLYDRILIPPTLSIAWPLQLAAGSYFLYKLMLNLTRDKQAAWLTLTVYLSSVGFLSGFSVAFMPSKPLSNVVYILALYLASRLDRRRAAGRLLFTGPGAEKYLLLTLLLLGTFLDEMPFFAFALLPVMFPDRFLPSRWTARGLREAALNAGILAAPFVVFLFLTLVVTPTITEHFFHYRFDYVSTILNRNLTALKTPPTEGPLGDLSAQTVAYNVLALFGSAVVPLETSRVLHLFSGQDLARPSAELAVYMIVVPTFLLALAALAFCKPWLKPRHRILMARSGAAMIAFVLFFAAVESRKGGWAYGLYYGSVFAVPFALLLGIWFAAIRRERIVLRASFAALAAAVVVLQIHNMTIAQRGFAEEHNAMSVEYFAGRATVDASLPVDRAALEGIWRAWREGHLEERLQSAAIPAGAVYLAGRAQLHRSPAQARAGTAGLNGTREGPVRLPWRPARDAALRASGGRRRRNSQAPSARPGPSGPGYSWAKGRL